MLGVARAQGGWARAPAVPGRRVMLPALAVWLLLTLALRPLALPDEGRYAEVAREMLLGDVWVPTLHGLPYFHKPPLTYWIDMAAMRLLGVDVFAARVAPALGAWLMGAALYLELHRSAGPRVAAIALAVLATCPFFFVAAQFANHDMLVAGLVTVAVVCAWRAVEPGQGQPLRWLLAAWGAAALGVLAKGGIGVVLPVLVVGPPLLAGRRWRDLLRLLHPLGLAVFALIAVPWFVLVQLRHPGFLDYFFVEQHLRRFAQGGFNNVQPFWFFAPVLLLLTLPWSLWLPAALRGPWAAGATTAPLFGSRALCAWWVVAVLGFFSLPSSKLVGYALPALAPLAALLAPAVARGRAWRWLLPLAAVLCVGLVAGVARHTPGSNRDLGVALAARLQPGDRVVLVDGAFFDVPFYAGLRQPPTVLADWDDPSIPRRDDWRKELADAARFAPEAGAQRLWRTSRAAELLCGVGRLWFVAAPGWQPPQALGPLQRVHVGRYGALLQASGRHRPGCP